MTGPAIRPAPAVELISRAILRCSVARDGRGRWRAERELASALGGRPLDYEVAQAARRVATVIASFPQRPAVSGAGAAPRPDSYGRDQRAAPAGYF